MLAYVESLIMSDATNTQSLPESPPQPQNTTNEIQRTNQELFNIALGAQQKNNLDEALNAYNQILNSYDLTKDQASVTHHNLTVIYLQKNEVAKAQIENYLALVMNPGNTAAQTLNKTHEAFKNSVVQTDRSWSTTAAFKFIPPEFTFLLLLGCFFAGARILLSYMKSRSIAQQDNLETPTVPWTFKTLVVMLVALGVSMGLRFYDEKLIRAIVINENTEVAASAGPNQAVITTVNPGLEVLVLRQQKVDGSDYVQIKSTGQFSGWVKAENVVLNILKTAD